MDAGCSVDWSEQTKRGSFGWQWHFKSPSDAELESFTESRERIPSALNAEAEAIVATLGTAMELNRRELSVFSLTLKPWFTSSILKRVITNCISYSRRFGKP